MSSSSDFGILPAFPFGLASVFTSCARSEIPIPAPTSTDDHLEDGLPPLRLDLRLRPLQQAALGAGQAAHSFAADLLENRIDLRADEFLGAHALAPALDGVALVPGPLKPQQPPKSEHPRPEPADDAAD